MSQNHVLEYLRPAEHESDNKGVCRVLGPSESTSYDLEFDPAWLILIQTQIIQMPYMKRGE